MNYVLLVIYRFVEPLVYGDYPFIMRALVGDALPEFTAEQKELVKGSYNYIGVNYYTARFTISVDKTSNDVYTTMDDYRHVTESSTILYSFCYSLNPKK